MITEVADPYSGEPAAFVELFSPAGEDLTSLGLRRWTYVTSTTMSKMTRCSYSDCPMGVALSSAGRTRLLAGEFLIVCFSKEAFNDAFDRDCDIESASVLDLYYGLDTFALVTAYDDSADLAATSDTIFDVFGELATLNDDWEFKDGRMYRNNGITGPSVPRTGANGNYAGAPPNPSPRLLPIPCINKRIRALEPGRVLISNDFSDSCTSTQVCRRTGLIKTMQGLETAIRALG